MKNKKQIFYISFISAIVTILLSVIIFLLLVRVDVDISKLEMPVVYVVSNMFKILRYIYGGVVNFVLGKFSVLQNILAFMPASEVFEVLIPVAVILGIGIGLIGSFFAVRKHADV